MNELLVGKSFRIVRERKTTEDSRRITIIIKRGAFGSGEHETTASCLEEMEELNLKDKTVLDFGCGTGILAIAAIKLGAQKAVCLDILKEAIETTLLNAELNEVEDKITTILGTLKELPVNSHFDIILANIYPEVLVKNAERIGKLLRPGGILVGSGVPWEDNADVLRVYKKLGFKVLKNRWLERYTTFVLCKSSERIRAEL